MDEKKNKDVEKALKKANREIEMETFGPGFHSKTKIHRSKKQYSRKQKHSSQETDYYDFSFPVKSLDMNEKLKT